MRARLASLPLAAVLLAGCGGTSIRRANLFVEAYKEQQEQNWQKCADLYAASVKELEMEASRSPGGEARAVILNYVAANTGGHGMCLRGLNRAAEAEADLTRCVAISGQALEQYKRLPWPQDAIAAWGRSIALGGNHYNRSACLKELGRLPEAIADLDAQIEHYDTACRRPPPLLSKSISEPMCNQVADFIEKRAVWNKELAAQGKREKP